MQELKQEVIKHLKQEVLILQRQADSYVIGSYEFRHYQSRVKSNKILTGKLENSDD
jgi:hypothetical protein